jgi:hypothetical protein
MKMIDISGPSGSGKSTYINATFDSNSIYQGYYKQNKSQISRSIGSIALLAKLFWLPIIDLGQMKWLFVQALNLDGSIYNKLNAFRNSILRFAMFPPKNSSLIVIDTGISHIPFILELGENEIKEYVVKFKYLLKSVDISLVVPPSQGELVNRLSRRGHGRVKSRENIISLAKKNIEIYNTYCETLHLENIKITLVKVNKEC